MWLTKKSIKRFTSAVCLTASAFFSNQSMAACDYKLTADWGSGFTAAISITNDTSTTRHQWEVSWEYSDSTRAVVSWGATMSGSNPYLAQNAVWNGSLAPGASVEFGIQGSHDTDSTQVPTLNGELCAAEISSSAQSLSSSEQRSSDSSAESCEEQCNWYGTRYPLCQGGSGWQWINGETCIARGACAIANGIEALCSSVANTSSRHSSSSDGGSRSSRSALSSSSAMSLASKLDNPWEQAQPYIDSEWSTRAASEPGGKVVADNPTAIWLESTADLTMLPDHLDAALEQGANLVTLVINNLPDKECGLTNYPAEFSLAEYGMDEYKREFISPLVAILTAQEYADIRVITVLEVNAIANLVTNLDNPVCEEAAGALGYFSGLRYALNRFARLPNVFPYLDMSQSGWLGWPDNFKQSAALVIELVESTEFGWRSLSGFATNIGGYVPVDEVYLPDPNLAIGGQPLRSAAFYEWNPYFDELDYAQDWRSAMIDLGAPESIGMLIDTSRNGWGGDSRPSAPSAATDLNTYVAESRLDKRAHRQNWCNQVSGLGASLAVSPHNGIDAFAWIKAPGISDGSDVIPACSAQVIFDRPLTGAMENPPARGEWFSAAFQVLLENAYPPVDLTVDNPWQGATPYVNPKWSALAAAEPNGEQVAYNPTAIWLDSIDKLQDLRWHLDQALAQNAELVSIVVNNLPNRDCSAQQYSPPELVFEENGLQRYTDDFINPLGRLFAEPSYKGLRIVVILEPAAIGNLLSSRNLPECHYVYSSGGYLDGIRHALNTFSLLPNVYVYIDIVNSTWLGWTDNFSHAAEWSVQLIESTNAVWASIAGFATNVGHYVPVIEPHLPDPNLNVGGQPIKSADFFEWNPYFDELDFAQDWRAAMIAQGAPASLGMVVDTSRSGWGGLQRPSVPSDASEVNQYVDESRVDRRTMRYYWCNQPGGLGERFQANPYEGIDAFAWIKAPGESDGTSLLAADCDPSYDHWREGLLSQAIDGAPARGEWFPEGFRVLLQNSNPPLVYPAD